MRRMWKLCLLVAIGAWAMRVGSGQISASSNGATGADGAPVVQAAAASETEFSMALTGDSIITRKLSAYTEPPFLKMVDVLRGSDVAFTNLEMLFHDYEPYPMNVSGGVYMRADPALAKELVWAGIDLVTSANNHVGDYGVLGMQLTVKHTREAGLVYAGVGNSLAEAREAKFLETPRGRVALIGVASTFPDSSRAGRTRGDHPARPGLNPLRFTTTYIVTRAQLEATRAMLKEMGLNAPAQGDSLNVLGNRFIVGDKPDVRTEPLKEDLDEITAVVKSASRVADYTIVTSHTHEGDRNRSLPAQFLVTFGRAVIDAGADVFVAHGPHVLRGIEIYKGKPILYSLGNFIFQNETLLRLPSENYEPFGLGPNAHMADFNDRRYNFGKEGFPSDRNIWESVVAVPRFKGKTLDELVLYPLTLGFGDAVPKRGRPMLADLTLARKIVDDLDRLSKPFGTTVTFENGVGKVKPSKSVTSR
ncbi:MAG: CapA family protein [Acidobacteria bacterium]|nr:CapA family protein [Acidobacteriota bacterium]